MGCFTRSKSEWDKDFWNNDKEFPEGSEEGKLRLKAYNKIVRIMEKRNMTKKQTTKETT